MTPERWRRIETLFHEARERAPADQQAFLDASCGADSDLRREVVSLLAQGAGTLLEHGVPAVAAAMMPSSPGSHRGRRLGPYVLGSLLGTGGMGEVYRARDEKLGRDVAVKILPDALVHQPQRLARSEREARILAALNHPNIAAIYGLEESDGLRGLVLELVDGVTLKEKLDAGALPLDQALSIAGQIAEALDAAHQKGIVHRDLKPANVKITPGGVVKVLDFGLAKIQQAEGSDPGVLPELATSDGVVLGTVAYMSPEQARGQSVDKRADIWAFGCVLYEMLTGERPFRGDSAADVLGAITTREPDWSLLPSGTPRRVRDVLRRCLAKDAARRLHDIADARLELDDALTDDTPSDAVAHAESRAHRSLSLAVTISAAAFVAAAAGAIWVVTSNTQNEPRVPMRVSIALPPDLSIYGIGRGSSVAFAPDGQRIVFVGISNGMRRLYERSLSGRNVVAIAGTEGAANPFFSPNGSWIGFTTLPDGGKLMKVAAEGGPVLTVVDDVDFGVRGATWTSDDAIVFEAINPKARGLWRVEAGGGRPMRVATSPTRELKDTWDQAWPQILPDGRTVLFTLWNNSTRFEGGRIAVQPLAGGEAAPLVEGASYGRVVAPDGRQAYVVYARPEGLLAAPFDLERLRLAGPAMPMAERAFTNLSGGAHFSISSNGHLAYVPGTLNELEKTLLWVGRDGGVKEIATIEGMGFNYRLSPDGWRLVRPSSQGRDRDLWIDDLERGGTAVRLTFGGAHNSPIWSRDGRRVIYASGLNENLVWRAADGSGTEERLTTSPHQHIPWSVSPDGTLLAYTERTTERGLDIWLLPLHPPGKPRLFLGTPNGERQAAFSPDGRWLAYSSNMSGSFEVYLGSVTDGRRQIPVSNGGGHRPLWSRDGRELYYRSVDPTQGGDMMVVSVDTTGNEPRIGTPRVLFASPYQGDGDIAPDGRFLLLKRTPEEASARTIELVLNWYEELQAKAARQ